MPRILIDGYNLLLRSGRGAGEHARADLVELARRYRGDRQLDLTLVFDSRTGSGTSAAGAPAGIRVEFAQGDADSHILTAIRRSRTPRDVLVVTSDRRLAEQARDLGARSEEVEAFLRRAGRRRAGRPGSDGRARLPASEVESWERFFAAGRKDDEF